MRDNATQSFSRMIRSPVPTGVLVSHVGLRRQRGDDGRAVVLRQERNVEKRLPRRTRRHKEEKRFARISEWGGLTGLGWSGWSLLECGLICGGVARRLQTDSLRYIVKPDGGMRGVSRLRKSIGDEERAASLSWVSIGRSLVLRGACRA